MQNAQCKRRLEMSKVSLVLPYLFLHPEIFSA